jgi:hypothetical protein
LPFYVQKIPPQHPAIFTWRGTLKTCWLPRRCAYSNKLLWFKKAYMIETEEEYDFQEPYRAYSWVDKDTYIIKRLKGEL